MMQLRSIFVAATLLLAAQPAIAGWKVMPAGQRVAVAKSGLNVVPPGDWNRASSRPGKRAESWTRDGLMLDDLTFFAVPSGEPIYRERSKKDEPLPKFDARMLAPEIVQLVEGSYRILLGTSLFAVDRVEPATLAGHAGVRFTYRYTAQDDEVRRRGEGRAAVIDGKLYLVTYTAPEIHYFDAGAGEARAIMDGAGF